MVKKKINPSEDDTEVEVETKASNSELKPYAEEAHEFLKILGKWVYLKVTSPSGYSDYHEETRKFLEKFKVKK